MLPGFQLHTDKDEQGLNTTTNKKVWADLSLLKGNEKSPSFNSTMVELHKMTPAEKENDRDAKYMLEHYRDKVAKHGFVTFAVYKYDIKYKNGSGEKGVRKDDLIKFFIEVWHPEGKPFIDTVPSAERYV